MSRAIEIGSVLLISLAVLLGGRIFLLDLTHYRGPALLVLAVLLFAQTLGLRRNYAEGGAMVRIRATRDVAFIAAIIFAFFVVLSPQRWSIGADIVAVEIGLILEMLSRFTPAVAG